MNNVTKAFTLGLFLGLGSAAVQASGIQLTTDPTSPQSSEGAVFGGFGSLDAGGCSMVGGLLTCAVVDAGALCAGGGTLQGSMLQVPIVDAGFLAAGGCALGGGNGNCTQFRASFFDGGGLYITGASSTIAGNLGIGGDLVAGQGGSGDLLVLRTCLLNSVDAGPLQATRIESANPIKVSSKALIAGNPNDAGTAATLCIHGREVLAANAAIVSFNPAFSAAPACTCSHEAAAPIGCGPTAAATTSGVTFGVPAGTGTVSWICCGNR